MSIIYDALKKVEESGNLTPKVKINKTDKPKPRVYLVYLLVAVLIFFVGNFSWRFLIKPASNNKIVARKVPPVAKVESKTPVVSPPTVAKEQTPEMPALVKPQPKPTFNLNGIFFSQNEGYALINNKIVKEGDTVAGAKVVRIKRDEVELEFEGSAITLSPNS